MNSNDFTFHPFSFNANVCAQVVTRTGKLKQVVSVHNKATASMTEGIVRFLRGEFTSSLVSRIVPNIGNNYNMADKFIPSYVGIGNVGVTVPSADTESLHYPYYDYTKTADASYYDDKLGNEIFFYEIDSTDEYHRQKITKSVKNGTLKQDTYTLTISAEYPFYQKLSDPTTWNNNFRFRTKENKQVKLAQIPDTLDEQLIIPTCIISEIGLFSGDSAQDYTQETDNRARLLARVVLEDADLIELAPTDTLKIQWQIGVESLDDNVATSK